jgi:hypothetical protein
MRIELGRDAGPIERRDPRRNVAASTAARRVGDHHAAGDVSSGRQRLHGRKPARAASAPMAWKLTFSRRGNRPPHDGRQ